VSGFRFIDGCLGAILGFLLSQIVGPASGPAYFEASPRSNTGVKVDSVFLLNEGSGWYSNRLMLFRKSPVAPSPDWKAKVWFLRRDKRTSVMLAGCLFGPCEKTLNKLRTFSRVGFGSRSKKCLADLRNAAALLGCNVLHVFLQVQRDSKRQSRVFPHKPGILTPFRSAPTQAWA